MSRSSTPWIWAWASFFGAKPVSSIQKSKQAGQGAKQKQGNSYLAASTSKMGFFKFPGYFDDICRMYIVQYGEVC